MHGDHFQSARDACLPARSAPAWSQAVPASCFRTAAPISRSIPIIPIAFEIGKIPLHTLIASIAKRDGKLWSVLGCMGADGQPQIQLQLSSAMIDHGLDIQEAIELPRFLSGRFGLGVARDTLHLEGRFSDDAVRGLAQRGHIINRWGAERNGRPRPRHYD